MVTAPFVPPPYPYDRLDRFKVLGDSFEGGLVDLSIGTPCDPPPPAVIEALASSNAERGYPPSVGTPALLASIRGWIGRRFDVDVAPAQRDADSGVRAELLHHRSLSRSAGLDRMAQWGAPNRAKFSAIWRADPARSPDDPKMHAQRHHQALAPRRLGV